LPDSPISPAEPAPWLPPPPDQDWTPQAASWQPPAAGEPWAPETAPTVVDSWAPDSGPWQPVPAAEPWEAGAGEPDGVSRSPLAVRRPRWLLVGISAVAAAALGFSVVMLTHRGNPSLPSSVLPTSTARPASGGGAPASPATAMATQAPLTPSQAQQVLAAYTTANNSANAQASQTLLATVEGGSSLAIDSGIYDAQRAAHAAGYPAYSPAAASYYIPLETPAAYPHWFAVRVSNSLLSAPGKVTQMEYLVFTQAAAGAPWLDSMEPFTLPSATAPSVALDASGHATAVSAAGTSLALPAATAGVATATALDSGAGQPASPGNLAEASELASLRQTVPSHPSITSSHSATTDPVFGLRTTDGGALLFYDVAARLTVTAAPGGTLHLNIPGFVSPANPASQVTLQYLDQLAVSDPPAGGGMPVQVIADYSGLTAAAG
jgi:hypothetical protein